MKVWAISDIGLVRKDNQDSYAVHDFPDLKQTACVVCDGMGGAKGGKTASTIAVDTYIQELKKHL